MEHFYTLQGEGAYTGYAAYFIRLGGCDVGCVWCDVKESWDASKHPHFDLNTIGDWLNQFPTPIAVITGGEPAMHDLAPLTALIQSLSIRTHIETSGSQPISGDWDWITLSPKKFKPPVDEALAVADEFKVVVFHPSDVEWALQFVPKLKPGCRLYLQPEWSKKDKIMPTLLNFIKSHPHWQLSLQTHKYIDIP